ncbi:hypothetical protein ONZ45_g11417 [Pleurotus djamor]|nr:hypothetical protein ONZ45_g11417 [Pleurotus djamor]
MHAIYTMSVTNWGNVFALLKQPSSISATFFLGIFVPPLVETFYLWRLYKLFGTPRACLFGLLVCWTRFCGWILFAVQETRLGYISGELFDHWTWLLIVLLVTGAILNGTIAGAMLYYLYGQRDTPLMRTKILVDRLIMWTVQTGLITGITYIVVLVVFLTMQDTCEFSSRPFAALVRLMLCPPTSNLDGYLSVYYERSASEISVTDIN